MKPVEDLDTPAVLVDLDVLEANVARMAEAARSHGVRLRPHAKTHKAPEIARLQLAAGAAGLCVAKLGEAEAFADAGVDDLFVAFPVVGAGKARRLLALGDRARLAIGVDSLEGAASVAAELAAAGRSVEALLKVDVGFARAGVLPENARERALRIAELRGLQLAGIFTFAGHVYGAGSAAAVAGIGRDEGTVMVRLAGELREAGLPIREVSVGSTPTARHAMAVPGVTECRPGVYVFNDASQVCLGTCGVEDCALTVLATVVSVPVPDRAVLDAGSKTLAADPVLPARTGHGWLVDGRGRLTRLSEEHGVVELTPGATLAVGEKVRVVPSHCCVVTNLHDSLVAVRGGRVEGEIAVTARGRVR